MWLIFTSLAAVITTAIWLVAAKKDEYRLALLSLIFWGTTIMVFVDHVMGYLAEGGEFFEITSDAALLGTILVIVALMIWELVLLFDRLKTRSFAETKQKDNAI